MSEAEMFDFGGALERLRAGKSVRRAGWPPGRSLSLAVGPASAALMLSTGDRGRGGWIGHHSDLLATDWETVKPQG